MQAKRYLWAQRVVAAVAVVAGGSALVLALAPFGSTDTPGSAGPLRGELDPSRATRDGRAPGDLPAGDSAASDDAARAAQLALRTAHRALRLLDRGSGGPLERRDALRLALDPVATRLDRVRALDRLGQLGDDEALDVIERVLRAEAFGELHFSAAAALGAARGPAADRLLASLLASPDGPARLGAIQALGARGGPDDILELQALVRAAAEPAAVRAAAARALAGLGGAEVVASLNHVLRDGADPELFEAVLQSLAARPFEASELQIRALLASPDLAAEAEVAVLSALGESSAGALPLLVEYARSAARPESRIAAVASLAMIEDAEGVADQLGALSLLEADPRVRGELYGALSLHSGWETRDVPEAALVERVLAETEGGVRLQGSRMLAARLRSHGDPALAARFDRQVLPFLASRANDPALSPYDRLLSIDALMLAGTGGARAALEELSAAQDAVVSRAAEKALEFPAL